MVLCSHFHYGEDKMKKLLMTALLGFALTPSAHACFAAKASKEYRAHYHYVPFEFEKHKNCRYMDATNTHSHRTGGTVPKRNIKVKRKSVLVISPTGLLPTDVMSLTNRKGETLMVDVFDENVINFILNSHDD